MCLSQAIFNHRIVGIEKVEDSVFPGLFLHLNTRKQERELGVMLHGNGWFRKEISLWRKYRCQGAKDKYCLDCVVTLVVVTLYKKPGFA